MVAYYGPTATRTQGRKKVTSGGGTDKGLSKIPLPNLLFMFYNNVKVQMSVLLYDLDSL